MAFNFWTGLKKDGVATQRARVWVNFTRRNQCLFIDPYLDPSHDPAHNNPAGGRPDPYWPPLRMAMGQTRTYSLRMHVKDAFRLSDAVTERAERNGQVINPHDVVKPRVRHQLCFPFARKNDLRPIVFPASIAAVVVVRVEDQTPPEEW